MVGVMAIETERMEIHFLSNVFVAITVVVSLIKLSIILFLLTFLSNDPSKVDSNFFCYAATVLSPHRNVYMKAVYAIKCIYTPL